tara:strand:- start:91 stop:1230 length:1140 start_codon:yes stop_codon:yes gene_type:complete
MASNAKNLAELLNQDSTVAVGDIADGSVTTAKLAADAVTAAKLADDSVVTANIVDGNVTAVKTTGVGKNKNMIINGAMQIGQRGTITGLQDGYGGVDRFAFTGNTAARATLSRHTSGNVREHGFPSSLKVDVTTADTSIASSDYHYVGYKFEGRHLQHIKKGTSNAESLTLQFYVKSPKTGTHIVQLYDQDNTRHISKSYTVSSANTWEKKTLTFAGDTTGTMNDDNNYSLQIYWWLLAGSDYTSGTLATSWASFTQANTAVGQVNVLDSTSNDFYLTGVQMEIGTQATDFDHHSYGDELQLCKRYYELLNGNTYPTDYSSATLGNYFWTVEKRGQPSVTADANSGGHGFNGRYEQGGYIYKSPANHNSVENLRGDAEL